MKPRRMFAAPPSAGRGALKRLLAMSLSVVMLAAGQSFGSAPLAAAATTVVPVPCAPTGAWFTEDVAPAVTDGGLLFAGPNTPSVNYYIAMSGNLQGIKDSSMAITEAAGYQVALVWEISRSGSPVYDSSYATISAEPYLNGWVAGATGTFTVTQATKVWTTKIANPLPGSQSAPISLADMGALFPNNVLLSEGLHLGSQSVAGQSSLVSAVTGCVSATAWVSAGTPSISGTPVVGGTLTAAPGTWTPKDVAFTYQWSADGSAITDATSSSYVPAKTDIGRALTVTVTGTKAGLASASATSAKTANVPELLPMSVTGVLVSVTGTVQVGSVLTATTSGWTPDGVTFTYQWLRDADPIAGATTATYSPVAGDVTHTLSVAVTGNLPGYASATVTSAVTIAVPVVPVPCAPTGAWFTEDVAPVVTDGGLLFAGPNTSSVNYYIAMSGNLQGIKDSSMAITASGFHAALVWEIYRTPSASNKGYTTITAEPYMNEWAEGQDGTFNVTQDTVVWASRVTSGPGSQGEPITLKAMGELFPENVLLTEGLHLGSGSSSVQSSLVSSLTGCVSQSAWVSAVKPTITGTPAVGARVVAQPGTWAPADVSFSYQWLLDDTPIVGATGVTYAPVIADVGHTLKVAVTGAKSGFGSAKVTSDKTAPVFVLPSVTAGSVSITGLVQVGSVLSAVPVDWAPAVVSFTYQWLLDGTKPITGAVGVTYTPGASDLGHTLGVRVTGATDGYLTVSVVSPATMSVSPTPGSFRSVSPSRLLDTRVTAPKLGSGETRTVQVTGAGGVPLSGVSAVVLTVTVTDTTGNGYLTVSPTGSTRPVVSNVNWAAGATIANSVTVQVGKTGQVDLFQSGPGTTQVIVDVVGYFVEGDVQAPGGFVSLSPSRILDTRTVGGKLLSGVSRDLQVTGFEKVPADRVSAVVLNVTVTETTGVGYLTVFPAGASRPLASNLNWASGVEIANMVTVRVGSTGGVSLFQSGTGTAQVVIDVAGYYVGGTATLPGMFVALSPSRLLDTRESSPIAGFGDLRLPILGKGTVPAAGVSAIVINATVTGTLMVGYLTAFPGTSTVPSTSNVNWSGRDATVPNLVTVQLGTDGSIKLHNGSPASAEAVVDIAGYYIAG